MSRYAAWIACLAILLASLAPSVSMALSAGRSGVALGELCSASGAKRFSIWADNRPDPAPVKKDGQHFKHCQFCQPLEVSAALPPVHALILPHPGPAQRAAVRTTIPLRPQSAWPSGQPRGPPVFS